MINPQEAIRIEEVRIGNMFISYADKPFSWTLEDFGHVNDLVSIDEIIKSPIPLTPDILEKAGFKYYKHKGVTSFDEYHSNDEETTHEWSFDIKGTELIEYHSGSLVKWGEQEYFTFQLERGFYRQKIKYLHQLQNLYYSLTGTELTIQL